MSKVKETVGTLPAIPPLMDFPAYRALAEKRQELFERKQALERQLSDFEAEQRGRLPGDFNHGTIHRESISPLQRAAQALLEDTSGESPKESCSERLGKAAWELTVVERALNEQRVQIATEVTEASLKVCADLVGVHRLLAGRIVQALAGLRDALQAESGFRDAIEREGYRLVPPMVLAFFAPAGQGPGDLFAAMEQYETYLRQQGYLNRR